MAAQPLTLPVASSRGTFCQRCSRAQLCDFDVGGVDLLGHARYADDMLLRARSAAEVVRMLDTIVEELTACGPSRHADNSRILRTAVPGSLQAASRQS
eukprot:4700846-Pyramimonas_sp.AAC.1